ncbi:MAG TPA: GNAT family N-acetyltransferase [Nocardioidaceae bacterium]|nr:GNAT family N-acetyltransferase [Nocardioidaceae bacterium]
MTELLRTLETYYDTVPRASATVEEVGPFTLFVRSDPSGWGFYARPRLGLDVPVDAGDVKQVRDRQRERGVAENLEWVHETTPSLLDAATADGLAVEQCPLLALPTDSPDTANTPAGLESDGPGRVEVLPADSPDLAAVTGAVHAGFDESHDGAPLDPGNRAEQIRSGLLVVVAAYDGQGAVIGGGSHSPRGTTTELMGIAVLPRARRRGVGAAITHALVEDARRREVRTIFLSAQDVAVARVYERVGFVRVGTACMAEPPASDPGR